jgi:hypothetical protein
VIIDRGMAIEIAAKARHESRMTMPWGLMTEKEKEYDRVDAATVLDAIGYDELVASRERAINLAVRLEEECERWDDRERGGHDDMKPMDDQGRALRMLDNAPRVPRRPWRLKP